MYTGQEYSSIENTQMSICSIKIAPTYISLL